jgi:hypothetical protein
MAVAAIGQLGCGSMPMLKQCPGEGCSTLTLGGYCVEHERVRIAGAAAGGGHSAALPSVKAPPPPASSERP